MPRLVIIDADEAERRRLAVVLTSAGFETLEAEGSVEGLLKVLDFNPDVIILAEEMPPLQAADLLAILRRASRAPIVVLGGGHDPEEVTALEAGADAYFRRGSSRGLLLARINALLRRATDGHSPSARHSPIPISLSPTERRLMACLTNHGGRPVGLDELRVEVWGETVGVATVRHYLKRLRSRLQRQPCGLQLQCVRGVGYRLEVAEKFLPGPRHAVAACRQAGDGNWAGVA